MPIRALVEFRKVKREEDSATGPKPGQEEYRPKFRLWAEDSSGEGFDLKIREQDFTTFEPCQKGDTVEVDIFLKDAQAALGGGRGTYTVSTVSSCRLHKIVERGGKPYEPKVATARA